MPKQPRVPKTDDDDQQGNMQGGAIEDESAESAETAGSELDDLGDRSIDAEPAGQSGRDRNVRDADRDPAASDPLNVESPAGKGEVHP